MGLEIAATLALVGAVAQGVGAKKTQEATKAASTKQGKQQILATNQSKSQAAQQQVQQLKAQNQAKDELSANTAKINERKLRKGKSILKTGSEEGLGFTGLGTTTKVT